MKDLALPDPPQLPDGAADEDGEWFTEKFLGVTGLAFRTTARLHSEASPYQQIDLYETVHHGKLLVLDGCVMLTELDEFIYHEMLAHVGAQVVGDPNRALVVGGGDGGVVRELLKYPGCQVTLAEIDERVVRVCQEHLPRVAGELEDPRVTLAFVDGVQRVADAEPGSLDLIAVDSTDPVGPAAALITPEFYRSAARALTKGGVFAAQCQSPLYHSGLIRSIVADLAGVFRHVALYWAVIPSYPGHMWTFCLGTDGRDPLTVTPHATEHRSLGTRYWTADLHRGAFALPPFVQALLPEGHPQRHV